MLAHYTCDTYKGLPTLIIHTHTPTHYDVTFTYAYTLKHYYVTHIHYTHTRAQPQWQIGYLLGIRNYDLVMTSLHAKPVLFRRNLFYSTKTCFHCLPMLTNAYQCFLWLSVTFHRSVIAYSCISRVQNLVVYKRHSSRLITPDFFHTLSSRLLSSSHSSLSVSTIL